MNQKDRLIDLIVDAENELFKERPHTDAMTRIERTVDCLLSNGVIVPLCKNEDTVYAISPDGKILDCFVCGINATVAVAVHGCNNMMPYSFDQFSYYFFATREEAEQALEEREQT